MPALANFKVGELTGPAFEVVPDTSVYFFPSGPARTCFTEVPIGTFGNANAIVAFRLIEVVFVASAGVT